MSVYNSLSTKNSWPFVVVNRSSCVDVLSNEHVWVTSGSLELSRLPSIRCRYHGRTIHRKGIVLSESRDVTRLNAVAISTNIFTYECKAAEN